MKIAAFIGRLFARILAFPFFLCASFISAIILFLKWNINYIRFGGEAIAYTKEIDRKTIKDVFDKLNEMQQKP